MQKYILTIIGLLAACAAFAAPKEYPAGYSAIAPSMDGAIDGDPAWEGVAWSDGFAKRVTAEKPVADTRFKALYTKDTVYIAAECMEPHMDKLKTEERYTEFWLYDVVELFIVPGKNEMIHLILSVYGSANEEIPGKVSVRTNHQTGWLGKSKRAADRWTAEICIPFFLLGVAPESAKLEIPFNLCRNSTPANEMSSWSFQQGSFKNLAAFGRLTLMPAPVEARGDLAESLRQPHWISLVKRWGIIRSDPAWKEIFKANPKEYEALERIYADPTTYASNATALASNLGLIEKQAQTQKSEHQAAIDKLLFNE